MTVKEFLERQRANPTVSLVALGFLMDLLTLLDEYGDEKCSVVAGKIRGQLRVAQ